MPSAGFRSPTRSAANPRKLLAAAPGSETVQAPLRLQPQREASLRGRLKVDCALTAEGLFSRLVSNRVQLPNYRVIKPLGAGTFAAVWLVEHEGRGWLRAAKVLHCSERLSALRSGGVDLSFEDALAQFEHEADVLVSLSHPHVIRFYDLVTTADGRPALLLEYCPTSLATLLGFDGGQGEGTAALGAYNGPVGTSDGVDIARCLARGLAHLHAQGYVHGAVNPANVLRDDNGVWKLADFGLATALNPSGRTRAIASLGSAYFDAPDQLEGSPDVRDDLFSLGAVLYASLTGRRPMGNVSAGRGKWPDIPDWLWTLVMNLLGPREERLQTAASLLNSIELGSSAPSQLDPRGATSEGPASQTSVTYSHDAGTRDAMPDGFTLEGPIVVGEKQQSALLAVLFLLGLALLALLAAFVVSIL